MQKNNKAKSGTLSASGQKAEALLTSLLADMDRDVKADKDGKARRYSLTDQMRVLDRVIKLEAIKAKLDDDDGAFFDDADPEDDDPEPGAEDET